MNASTQFTVAAGTKTPGWGPFQLVSAETAVFDFQAVGSSSGAAIIEFSKNNVTWEQVGTQAKNNSTSWVTGKMIDLSATTAPWGPTIYIRFNNNSTKDVNVKNLVITGIIYTTTVVTEINDASGRIVSEKYYNLNGQNVPENSKGIIIKKTVFENGKSCLEKHLKLK